MKTLIINKLILFSSTEKKAKVFEFADGINIITSSEENGNKLGKSVILKNIYYALGADCYFEDKWNPTEKIIILYFTIGDAPYSIFRCNNLFKLFSNQELILYTTKRTELAKKLAEIFEFKVMLPSHKENELELAPPCFSYILNYLDQDGINCSNFSSFKHLDQFPNYKENLLLCHFGVFTEEYFSLIQKKNSLNKSITEVKEQLNIISCMLDKIDKELNEGKCISESIEKLHVELKKYSKDYEEIYSLLLKTKNSLLECRNKGFEINSELKSLNSLKNKEEKNIDVIYEKKCPFCNSLISDSDMTRIGKTVFSNHEDTILLQVQLQEELNKIEKKIIEEEKSYKEILDKLNMYDSKVKDTGIKMNDILKYKGLNEIHESVMNDWNTNDQKLLALDKQLKNIRKQLKEYEKEKKLINEDYFTEMVKGKMKLDLQEIEDDNFKSISTPFIVSGSKKPLATVLWYLTLNRVRDKYNPDAIKFPIVFDSPKNGEIDNENKKYLLDYIFSSFDSSKQYIISILGFDEAQYKQYNFSKIITLENKKYSLLEEDVYENIKAEVLKFVDIEETPEDSSTKGDLK